MVEEMIAKFEKIIELCNRAIFLLSRKRMLEKGELEVFVAEIGDVVKIPMAKDKIEKEIRELNEIVNSIKSIIKDIKETQ